MQNNKTARRVIESGELPPVSGVSVLGGEKTPNGSRRKGKPSTTEHGEKGSQGKLVQQFVLKTE